MVLEIRSFNLIHNKLKASYFLIEATLWRNCYPPTYKTMETTAPFLKD